MQNAKKASILQSLGQLTLGTNKPVALQMKAAPQSGASTLVLLFVLSGSLMVSRIRFPKF